MTGNNRSAGLTRAFRRALTAALMAFFVMQTAAAAQEATAVPADQQPPALDAGTAFSAPLSPPTPLGKPHATGAAEGSSPDPSEVEGATAAAPLLSPEDPASRFNDTLVPYAPSNTLTDGTQSGLEKGAVYLVARLTEGAAQISDGLVWRVYGETPNASGELELVATAMGGDAEFRLDPGAYLIHTSYGYAGSTNRLVVGRGVYSKTVVLNAGGVKLNAALGPDDPLPADDLRFDILGMNFNAIGEREVIVSGVKPEAIVRLNAGTYHVVSRYGDVNAIVRADISVEAGKLTSATLFQNAASVTLKLVNDPGGEAIANTAWTILTPGGDTVVEGNGAFPSFVLAAGEYEVVARNNGVNYSRNFMVVSGENEEVEVLARTETSNVSQLPQN